MTPQRRRHVELEAVAATREESVLRAASGGESYTAEEAVPLVVECIDDRAAIPLSAGEWNGLVAGNETNSIFQTYEWFDAWWTSFGRAGSLYFLLVRSRGQPVGFAALMIRRNSIGLRQVEFVGHGNADYQDFVLPCAKRAALAAICDFLRADSERWDRFYLTNIPQRSMTVSWLCEEAAERRMQLVEEAHASCPTLLLEDRVPTVRRLIDKYSMRRPFNWFSRRGRLTFRQIEPHEFASMFPSYFDQHIRRWRAKGVHSLFEEQRHQRFYQELAGRLQPTGWLLFSVVELDGAPLAFHFGFDYAGSVIWYKPSFEIRHAARSPGLLLIRNMIQDALERKRHELDFTIGDEQFKDRFANAERVNVNVAIYHNRFLCAAAVVYRRARRIIAAVLRASDKRTWPRPPRAVEG